MVSATRFTRLGLAAVTLVFVSSFGVLASRSLDQQEPPHRAPDLLLRDTTVRHVANVATRSTVSWPDARSRTAFSQAFG